MVSINTSSHKAFTHVLVARDTLNFENKAKLLENKRYWQSTVEKETVLGYGGASFLKYIFFNCPLHAM